MVVTRPDLIRVPSRREPPEGEGHCPPEREHERDRARPRARGAEGDGAALVVPRDPDPAELEQRPGGVARARQLSGRWCAEARVTARSALDGSVWRARPAALRDIHARTQRGEWAGDSAVLLLAGQVYGYVALLAVAGLYGLAEVIKRPSRLAMVLLCVLITVLTVVV